MELQLLDIRSHSTHGDIALLASYYEPQANGQVQVSSQIIFD